MSEPTLEQVRQGEQDLRDGEALRLLLEALPEGRWNLMVTWPTRAEWVVTLNDRDRDDSFILTHAFTIAAAADACRAALAATR